MTTLALVDPLDLAGTELREELERRPMTWSHVRLLTTDEDGVGTVTQFREEAMLVTACDRDSLVGADVVFVCRPDRLVDPSDLLPPAATAIFLGSGGPAAARPALAWRVPDGPGSRSWWTSPDPVIVALARLLSPLVAMGRRLDVNATVLLPASTHGRQAMDELFAQTQAILAFQPSPPSEVFGHQIAFNLFPAVSPGPEAGPELTRLLGLTGTVSLQCLQGSAFHGLAASVFVGLDDDPGAAAVDEALRGGEGLTVSDDPDHLGPIDAAAQADILVGEIRQQPGRPGGYWLWAVADNLTGVGAHHAAALAEALGA